MGIFLPPLPHFHGTPDVIHMIITWGLLKFYLRLLNFLIYILFLERFPGSLGARVSSCPVLVIILHRVLRTNRI